MRVIKMLSAIPLCLVLAITILTFGGFVFGRAAWRYDDWPWNCDGLL